MAGGCQNKQQFPEKSNISNRWAEINPKVFESIDAAGYLNVAPKDSNGLRTIIFQESKNGVWLTSSVPGFHDGYVEKAGAADCYRCGHGHAIGGVTKEICKKDFQIWDELERNKIRKRCN